MLKEVSLQDLPKLLFKRETPCLKALREFLESEMEAAEVTIPELPKTTRLQANLSTAISYHNIRGIKAIQRGGKAYLIRVKD